MVNLVSTSGLRRRGEWWLGFSCTTVSQLLLAYLSLPHAYDFGMGQSSTANGTKL